MRKEVKALKPHVSINVRNVTESIEFYRKMLGIEPAKVRTGYAKFDVQNPPLNAATLMSWSSAPAQSGSNSPRRLIPSVHWSPWFYGKDFHARRVIVDVNAGK